MIFIVLIAIVFLFTIVPTIRCAMLHPVGVVSYGAVDGWHYFRRNMADYCASGEIVAYVGLFGKGKTLSAVHRIVNTYHQYNGKMVWCQRRQKLVTQRIKILSNVSLSIPYEDLVSLEQIVLCAEKNNIYDDEHDTLTVTLVLGDEFSVQMNSRNFKSNMDPLFLNTLLTCRHYNISLYYTAQRFGHVDALMRQVTSYVIDCDKWWRFQRQNYYDAWDMENASNPTLIAPLRRSCWFVKDSDYSNYNTLACVGNLKKSMKEGDMMKEEEILALQRNENSNPETVSHPSKKWRNRQRKK